MGARPLKRVLKRRIVDQIARAILEGTFRDGDTVRVEAEHGELGFSKASPASETPRK